jgi:hypothetical protein
VDAGPVAAHDVVLDDRVRVLADDAVPPDSMVKFFMTAWLAPSTTGLLPLPLSTVFSTSCPIRTTLSFMTIDPLYTPFCT